MKTFSIQPQTDADPVSSTGQAPAGQYFISAADLAPDILHALRAE